MNETHQDRERRDAASFVLSNPQGRRFLWWLMGRAGLHQAPIRADAHMTAFACGRQDLGQQVLAELLSADAEAYLTMLREGREREREQRDPIGDGRRNGAGRLADASPDVALDGTDEDGSI